MRNLASSFTMRKDGVLPRGDWYTIKNEADDKPAEIFIYDEIGFWGTEASTFVQELVKLDADEIVLHLNSPGGEVFDGLAIYNSLKQNKAKITVMVDGIAASAASFIAQAGDEIIMARNSQMMIHDGIAFAYGNQQDMLETADLLGKISDNIADIYAQRAGETPDYWRNLMRDELWMTGQEAVDFGLADKVLDTTDEEAEKAMNKWDLTFYNHAGRERAESPSRIAARLMLTNQTKEKEMAQATPKNTEGSNPAPAEDPEGEGTPTPGATPTGDPTEPGVEAQPDGTEGNATQPTEPVTSTQPSNSATPQGVVINGKLETDWGVINRHFAMLNETERTRQETFRNEFVEQLATDNKIGASQIQSLQQHAASLTDEQFATFKASYESAPVSSLFGAHPTGQQLDPSNGPRNMTDDEAKKDRIEILEGVVAMLSKSQTDEQVKNSNAYSELQMLLGKTDATKE